MRLPSETVSFLKQVIQEKIPGSSVYLFGSRTDDNLRGGDIDIMILTDKIADKQIIRKIRLEIIKKLGWQKIDLLNFKHSDDSLFRKIIENQAILL
jgi:predicted nucleotidyltransferase